VVDDNIPTNPETTTPEPQPAPEVPLVKAPPIESRFLFVDVAALRAKQLRRGARVRLVGADGEPLPDLPKKPERLAMEEVRNCLVNYELVDTKAAAEEEEEQQ
jgi:DNA-directed RNA polymerase subunit K/omega